MPGRLMEPFVGWHFCFGEVIHGRLRPVRHTFRYPAFMLAIPVATLDGAARGNWLFGVNRRALIGFRESDHGAGEAGARAWIHALLAEAGITADGELRLYAFPRMLGYAFKPVSFWFCHDANGDRRAIVAEVNNTFGERHCYLLADSRGAALQDGQTLSARKVFHVSPFCGVEGSYRFRFLDRGGRMLSRIDHDDGDGPLLATSISGRLQPIGLRSVLQALFGYPWFTFGVIARIHWQALRLWLKRVPVHRKPDARPPFLSRGSR